MPDWLYRFLGFWVRREACKLAAICMSKRLEDDSEGICPKLWSITVFFEQYMLTGAENTAEDFGPKEPVELVAIKQDTA